MKKKSIFGQIVLLIVVVAVCLVITIGLSLYAGFYEGVIIDFSDINIANVLPVLAIGGFITFFVVLLVGIFIIKNILSELKNQYKNKQNKEN